MRCGQQWGSVTGQQEDRWEMVKARARDLEAVGQPKGRQYLREKPGSLGNTEDGETRSEGKKPQEVGTDQQGSSVHSANTERWAGAGAEHDSDKEDLCSLGADILQGEAVLQQLGPQSSCQAGPSPWLRAQ